MSLSIQDKLKAGLTFDIEEKGKYRFLCSLKEMDGLPVNKEARKGIMDILKSAGLNVQEYFPEPSVISWMPDPEPVFGLFPPENPAPLVKKVAKNFHVRHLTIAERLSKLPVKGVEHFTSFPYGWTSIAETIVDAIEYACERDPSGVINVMQIKEKFGSLRFYSRYDGSDEFMELLDASIRWAEAVSHVRCSITGKPGEIVGPAWLLCLSKEAQFWRMQDRGVFRALIYPTLST